MYFKTTDPKSRKINKGSHGVGLNVCKRFAQRLGGDLNLNSDYPGPGSEFILTLSLNIVSILSTKRQKIEKNFHQDLAKIYECEEENDQSDDLDDNSTVKDLKNLRVEEKISRKGFDLLQLTEEEQTIK